MDLKVVNTVALISLVGIAGFGVYRQELVFRCNALEDAYLNTRLVSFGLIGSLVNVEDEADLATGNDYLSRNESTLSALAAKLRDDCGREARRTAERKAKQLGI